ncbi:MAG: hypothetical protein K2P84_11860 [Undibacterium sp.]|nr:hypothetical protein [Undibacterium sp.]
MNPQHPLYLKVADRIGIRLWRDALWDGKRCTWLGWSHETVNQRAVTAYRSLAGELYDGSVGIALFLAELYQFTGDVQQLRVLEGAVNHAISLVQDRQDSPSYGCYNGLSGVAWALSRIGYLLKNEQLIETSLTLVLGLRGIAPDVRAIDVVGGSAGTIPVLLSMAQIHDRGDLYELAKVHGNHLLALAEASEQGYSWNTLHRVGQANLLGHSHGVAGIVTALLELHHATGEQKFLHAALEGLRYERLQFNAEAGNWPDLRQSNKPVNPTLAEIPEAASYMVAWCHGAPGIGLSRLRNSELLPQNIEIKQDLENAIQTTANSLLRPWIHGSGNYSLCHGASGNAELMIMAGQALKRPELTAIAEKVADEGIEYYVQQGLPWPCGVTGAGETPSLMLGTAGIGHFYLRLFQPETVPSILICTPPKTR